MWKLKMNVIAIAFIEWRGNWIYLQYQNISSYSFMPDWHQPHCQE